MIQDGGSTYGSHSHSTSFPLRFRLRKDLYRIFKRISSKESLRYPKQPLSHFVSISAVCIISFVILIIVYISRRSAQFDDVQDMRLVDEEDALYLAWKRNISLSGSSDPLGGLNLTDVKQKRLLWDHINGELARKEPPPILTKYKTRLLRELLRDTYYKLGNRWNPALDVSCNYLNDIPSGTKHTFQCSGTSHRCPDGSFSLQLGFVPKEGTSITWEDVVIVIAISSGSEPLLEAAAETWIPRLRPEASLFFARDNTVPELPASLRNRNNTYIFEYQSDVGFENLDVKVFQTLNEVFSRFAPMGKKYIVKVDIDAYLYGHNMIRFLNNLEHNFGGREQALYFGHPFCGHGEIKAMGYEKWCYAGGGAYGMSIEALHIFLTQVKGGCVYFYDYVAQAPNFRPVNDKYGGRYEDIMIGRCIRQAKARSHLRGTSLLACGSFFPYAPLHYYHTFGNSKEAMCRKLEGDIITLHNLEPSAMRFLDGFLFDYPLGGDIKPFSPENENVDRLISQCTMNGKKMSCNLPDEANTIFR